MSQNLAGRIRAVNDEIQRLGSIDNPSAAELDKFDRLHEEFDALYDEWRTGRKKEIRNAMKNPANVIKGDSFDEAPEYMHRGDPYALPDRMSYSTADSEVRSAALSGIEGWNAEDELKESATRLVERTDEPRGVGEHILRTSHPAYLSAFQKFMRDPEGFRDVLDNGEREAWAAVRKMKQRAALDTSGAVLPSPLDPSIVLANAGTLDPMRGIARVDQTTSNTKRYITSAGVTASFDGELTETSDDTPALTEVELVTRKAQAFVQSSVEAALDQPDVAAEVARMFGDAKANLEGTKFISGAAGSDEPIGIETALAGGSSVVSPATGETFAAADVYAVIEALPARYRRNARWMAELSTLNQIDQFETSNGAKLFPEVGSSNPVILRKAVSENSNVDAFSDVDTGATAANHILYAGDFSQMVILDRVGLSISFIPHLLNVANNLPDGRVGWYAYWRTASDVLVDDAFRVLNLATTA